MTKARTPQICDFCSKEIDSELMSYTVQFNQRQPYGKGQKGEFVSSKNKADMCKSCFTKVVEKSEFKIQWKHMKQQADKTWAEVEVQEQTA